MPRQPKWDWCEDTLRFTSCDPQHPQPAIFQLQQVTDDEFKLLQPFRYTRADGTVIPVDHQWLGRTDLAYQFYRVVEWLAKLIGERLPATRDEAFPAPKPFRKR